MQIGNVGFAQEKNDNTLRFGVAAMIAPKETLSSYRQILYYISDKIHRPVQMVQRKSYTEMDELLRTRNVEIAMLCSGPYVTDHDQFGAELLVAPVMYGKPFYHSYIIVHKDASFKKMEDLRGKTFAMSDPKSNSGCLVPSFMLAQEGETMDSFFSKHLFSGHHSKSIEMVAKKEVDGAAVDHLVWEYLNKKKSKYVLNTQVIIKSPEYGMPPIAVHPDIDPLLKKKLRDILLNMHNDSVGREVLEKIYVDKFIVPPDSNYDSVRAMIKWIDRSNLKKTD